MSVPSAFFSPLSFLKVSLYQSSLFCLLFHAVSSTIVFLYSCTLYVLSPHSYSNTYLPGIYPDNVKSPFASVVVSSSLAPVDVYSFAVSPIWLLSLISFSLTFTSCIPVSPFSYAPLPFLSSPVFNSPVVESKNTFPLVLLSWAITNSKAGALSVSSSNVLVSAGFTFPGAESRSIPPYMFPLLSVVLYPSISTTFCSFFVLLSFSPSSFNVPSFTIKSM